VKLPLKKIAQKVGGKVIGDDRLMITGVNSLDAAESGEISFFADRRFKESLKRTEASAVIITEQSDLYDGPQLIVLDAALAFAEVVSLFAPPVPRHPGISERAVVHENSRVGKDVSIYPMVYVGSDAVIGEGTVLFPGVFIGDRVKIGSRSVIYPNVTILEDCLIGNDVIIYAGVIIGSDGFGYVKDGSKSVKVPQIGIVQIDDHVEIGANSCIDRAALGKTWLKRGVKVDNLVQVAHNVVIGEDTIVLSQVGISGSVNIGREAILAGQVGIADHKDIGDQAVLGPKTGIAKDVLPGEVLSGSPAMPHRLWLKTSHLTRRLPEFNERLRDLEKKMEELEKKV
jgi:UDP-3-O-[3-hydroxymyristoyl] glucosamine N-acyltransferase